MLSLIPVPRPDQSEGVCKISFDANVVQTSSVPNWSSASGRLEQFLHQETLFMLLCVIFTFVICWNSIPIWCFLTRSKRKDRRGLSDTEVTKIAISETATNICVFSLLLTCSTPMVRLFKKKWMLHTSFFSVNEALGMHFHEASMSQNAGLEYEVKLNSSEDYSWVCHASFGLLWVILGCVAIRTGASASKVHRKYISKIAAVSLIFHFYFSCSNLYLDVAKHVFMNKVALLGTWSGVIVHVANAIAILQDKRVAYQDRITTHMRHMFLAYIQSIEGSGQIRLVSSLFYIFGRVVSHYCRRHLYRFDSSECAWKYLEQMFFTRIVSLLYLCLYSWGNPVDKEMRKYVKRTAFFVPIEFLILKGAEYADAQNIIGWYQLIYIICRLYKTASIIKQEFELPSEAEPSIPSVIKTQMPLTMACCDMPSMKSMCNGAGDVSELRLPARNISSRITSRFPGTAKPAVFPALNFVKQRSTGINLPQSSLLTFARQISSRLPSPPTSPPSLLEFSKNSSTSFLAG